MHFCRIVTNVVAVLLFAASARASDSSERATVPNPERVPGRTPALVASSGGLTMRDWDRVGKRGAAVVLFEAHGFLIVRGGDGRYLGTHLEGGYERYLSQEEIRAFLESFGGCGGALGS